MLCYIILRHAILCNVTFFMLCNVMLCCVVFFMFCHVMLSVILCMLCYVILCYIYYMLWYDMFFHIIDLFLRPVSTSRHASFCEPLFRMLWFVFSDEKSTYNDISATVPDSSISTSNSNIQTANTAVKREPNTSPLPTNAHNKSLTNQNLPLTPQSQVSIAEASPRKKPRKQNVYVFLPFSFVLNIYFLILSIIN